MADDRHERAQARRHVAVDDLAVVEIELQLEIGQREVADQDGGLVEIVQEIAGHVAPVDRLDEQINLLRREPLGGIA